MADRDQKKRFGWLLLRLAISSLSRPRARCPPAERHCTLPGEETPCLFPCRDLRRPWRFAATVSRRVIQAKPSGESETMGGLGVAWALIFACNGTSAASPVTRPSQPRVSVVCDRDGRRPANVHQLVQRLPQPRMCYELVTTTLQAGFS